MSKTGGDDGHVGQVGAAGIGRVEDIGVAGLPGRAAAGDNGADAFSPSTRDGRACAARWRRGGPWGSNIAQEKSRRSFTFTECAGVLQHAAHLFGDGHEEVVEYLEHHGVDIGPDGGAARARGDALEHEVSARRHPRLPPFLDHGEVAVGSTTMAGPATRCPGASAARSWIGARPAPWMNDSPAGSGSGPGAAGRFGLRQRVAGGDGLDARGVDDHGAAGGDKAIAPPVRGLERGERRLRRVVGDVERRVGAPRSAGRGGARRRLARAARPGPASAARASASSAASAASICAAASGAERRLQRALTESRAYRPDPIAVGGEHAGGGGAGTPGRCPSASATRQACWPRGGRRIRRARRS